MHAMTRSYTGKGAAELVKLLVSRKSEVEKLMSGVPGLVSYDVIATSDGCVTVTVCKDSVGTKKSLELAKDWLKKNTGHLGLTPPIVSEGEITMHIGAKVAATAS